MLGAKEFILDPLAFVPVHHLDMAVARNHNLSDSSRSGSAIEYLHLVARIGEHAADVLHVRAGRAHLIGHRYFGPRSPLPADRLDPVLLPLSFTHSSFTS